MDLAFRFLGTILIGAAFAWCWRATEQRALKAYTRAKKDKGWRGVLARAHTDIMWQQLYILPAIVLIFIGVTILRLPTLYTAIVIFVSLGVIYFLIFRKRN